MTSAVHRHHHHHHNHHHHTVPSYGSRMAETSRSTVSPSTIDEIDSLSNYELEKLERDETFLLEVVSRFTYTRSITEHLDGIRESIEESKRQFKKKEEEYGKQFHENVSGLEKLREDVKQLSKEKEYIQKENDKMLKTTLDNEIERLEKNVDLVLKKQFSTFDDDDGKNNGKGYNDKNCDGDVNKGKDWNIGKCMKERVERLKELYGVKIRRDALNDLHGKDDQIWQFVRWNVLTRKRNDLDNEIEKNVDNKEVECSKDEE